VLLSSVQLEWFWRKLWRSPTFEAPGYPIPDPDRDVFPEEHELASADIG
jgi:hypothetical protein